MSQEAFTNYFSTYSGDPVYVLVNRGGSSYYVDASLYQDKAEDDDIFLINRAGSSYKVRWADFNTKPRDSDILLCKQGDISYYVPFSRIKNQLHQTVTFDVRITSPCHFLKTNGLCYALNDLTNTAFGGVVTATITADKEKSYEFSY